MSKTSQWRRMHARVAAIGVAAALLLSFVATASQAMPVLAEGFPSGPMTIEIHKFEQPDQLGTPGDGLEITDSSLLPGTAPVAGATFTATRVPGIDLTSNNGQREAGALTAEQAAQLITQASATVEATDTTDGNGEATLELPDTGLFYVEETVTPAGFVAAESFLVALPLTNPQSRDSWLTTVHVYPKNTHVTISLEVTDQNAVALGDTVHWQARAAIPGQANNTKYVIRLKIDSGLELVGEPNGFTVALDCDGCQPLVQGTDFTRVYDAATGEYVIEFTQTGRSVLTAAVAAHPDATVTVDYDTRVLAEGELRNDASLLVGGASEPVTDSATTKWGPLAIEVRERGNPSNLIPGAHFQLFLSAEDATAGRNPVTVDGVDEWITDADGRIVIHGLRFSNFVNGLDRARGDALFRDYFVIITQIPEGYTGEKVPNRLTVISTTDPEVALVELERVSAGGGSGDDLPLTGTQISGLIVLVFLLVGGGFILILRRNDRNEQSGHL